MSTLREKCPYWEFFWSLYFPAFGLNTERYSVSLRILILTYSDWISLVQSECGKIKTKKLRIQTFTQLGGYKWRYCQVHSRQWVLVQKQVDYNLCPTGICFFRVRNKNIWTMCKECSTSLKSCWCFLLRTLNIFQVIVLVFPMVGQNSSSQWSLHIK